MKQLKGKKALAAILTAAMTMSLMACGSSGSAATEEKPAGDCCGRNNRYCGRGNHREQ